MQDLCRLSVVLSGAGDFRTDTKGVPCIAKRGTVYLFYKNPSAAGKRLTHGRADTEFLRDRVPMTKEEVRDVSICKLKLHKGAVFYDIGSGTGSIAVEAAGLSNDIRVFAIEKKRRGSCPDREEQRTLWLRKHRDRKSRCTGRLRNTSKTDTCIYRWQQ